MKRNLKEYLLEVLPENIAKEVNRSFEVVGDIAIVEIGEELVEYENIIGDALLKTNSNIKTVLKKSGIHGGEFRTQDLVYLSGEEKYETIYLENNIRLKIDPGKVYFSARLSTERGELMDNLEKDKRVLVMFSGAGPYTYVGYRKQPNIAGITSIEINPIGHKYAIESLELNKSIAKKTIVYENLINFMKDNEIPIIEKKIVSLINNLKLNFINDDVRVAVEKLKLKFYKEDIENFHNQLFSQNPKDIFSFLLESKTDNLFLDLDDNSFNKNSFKYIFLLFSDKFNFIIKKDSINYLFDTQLTKSYLYQILFHNYEFSNINLYDEIFMPLPKDAELFLDCAFKVANKNCVVHMYDFVHENEFPHKSEVAVLEASKKHGKKVEIIETRKAGQYSPRKYRVCCDFKIL